MKKTVIVLMLAGLAGCSNGYSERSFPVLPDELKDCKFFSISNENGNRMMVARCPNSVTTTTYTSGKTTKSAVVIDGVTYEEKK